LSRRALSRPRRLKPVPAALFLSRPDDADSATPALISARGLAASPYPMVDLTTFAGCIGKPQQQIAMACERRAEADEIMAAQFVERAQKMMLIAQPALVFCDDARAVAVRTYPEWIAPFAAAAEVDGTCWNTDIAFVENPAYRYRLVILLR